MFMCGNYGDPAAGYYTMDIYNYFRKVNPEIVLGMNTNGAIQSTFFWHALGKLCNKPEDYCVFSIDGLEDTNHVYRENVNWKKLMSNAEAYIAAGGSAHWDMLVYKHNQHQVDACEQLAKASDALATVKLTWKTDTPNSVCKTTCSSNKNKTSFTNQWQREVQLC